MPKTNPDIKETVSDIKEIKVKSRRKTSQSKKTAPAKGLSARKKPEEKVSQKDRLAKKLPSPIKREIVLGQAMSAPTEKKKSQLIPMGVRVFFGVALFSFCTALYINVLLPNIQEKNRATEVENSLMVGDLDVIVDHEPSELSLVVEETFSDEEIDLFERWPVFLKQFYQVLSQKDVDTLITFMDGPLQRSTEIRRFFSSYKITPFIDHIEHNRITPENIQLLDTSASGVEEYQYELNYHLVPNGQDFREIWVAKVRYTENGPRLASIYCQSHRCSFNPFFRPENYGLMR